MACVNKTLLCQHTQTRNENEPTVEYPAIEEYKSERDEKSTKSLTDDDSPSWQISSTAKDEHHLDQFTLLLSKEISGIKRQNVLRKLKKDMMDLVYKAQEDDEKNLDY